MTDTGQVPGQGQPENAGGHGQPQAVPTPADHGPTQPPGDYPYLGPADGAVEEDDLLMPGAQGAWSEQSTQQMPHPAQPLPQAAPYDPAVAYAPAAAPAGDHETGGRDTGSVDLGAVRVPQPAAPQQPAHAAPPRRPLHMGPPVPDATGGVVRSLADRGPAEAPQPAARQAARPAAGPEYLDVPTETVQPAPQPAQAQPAAPQAAGVQQVDDGSAAAQPQPAPGQPSPQPVLPADAAQQGPQPAPLPPYGQQPYEGQLYAEQAYGAAGQGPLPGPQLGEIPSHAPVQVQPWPEAPAQAAVAPVAHPTAAPAGAEQAAPAVQPPAAATQQDVQDGALPTEREPSGQLPADQLPVGQAPAEQLPVEQLSAQQLPVEEVPAGQLPVEELPAEQATVEQVAVEQAAAEPAPAQAEAGVAQAEQVPAPQIPAQQVPGEQISGEQPQAAPATVPAQVPAEAGAQAAPDDASVPGAVPVPVVEEAPVTAETPGAGEPSVAAEVPGAADGAQADAPAQAGAQAAADEAAAPVAAEAPAEQPPAAEPVANAAQAADATTDTAAQQAPEQPSEQQPAEQTPAPEAAAPEAAAQQQPADDAAAAQEAVPAAPQQAAAEPIPAQAPEADERQPAAEPAPAPAAADQPQPTAAVDQAADQAPAATPAPDQPEQPEAAAPQPAPEAPAEAPQSAEDGSAAEAAPATADAAPQAPEAAQAPAEEAPQAVIEAPEAQPQAAGQSQPAAPADAEGQQPAAAPDEPQATPQDEQSSAQPAAAAEAEAPEAEAAAAPAEAPAQSAADEPVAPAPAPEAQAVPEAQAAPVQIPAQATDEPAIAPQEPAAEAAPQAAADAVPAQPAPADGTPEAEAEPEAEAQAEADARPHEQDEAQLVEHAEHTEGDDERSAEAPAEPAPVTAPAPAYDDSERAAVHRVIRERRDIRNGFRSDPIPNEVLLRVLEAAHTAPSVGHSQPWDFVVIRSDETRAKMHELAMRQREAYAQSLPKARAKQFRELKIEAILETPVNIVVTADSTRGGRHTLGRHTQPQMAPYSSALAVENLWLAARAEGLGVGWVSFFDEREMVRELDLPEHLEVVAYLCVGYVDEFPDDPELLQAGWSKRRPLSWVVHEETYGRRALPGEDPHDLLQETLAGIRPLDAKALGEAWERQKRMTKPAGALGMLEIISAQLSGLSRKCPPPIPEPAAVAIFAGDHGVHAQGVTPWPQEVTGQMVANFLGGGAVCNAFATQVGAEVCVIDVGVASELPATPGLLPRKVRPGTADFTQGPAMTQEDVLKAIEVGIETARDLVSAGNKALLTGEMGIANTTASAALIAVYTGVDPAEVTGRGTGINDETHARKVEVVRHALEFHQPDPADPIGVLAALGGLEHAAMVGLILGGASLRTPVILDGVSAGAAALVARAIAPEALAACIAGHRSAEPGHVAALNKLGLRPLVDLDLRLGEGTGALLALPVVQSAARAMHEVATFDSAGVTEKS
ncbi:nicotinate-nucleotide--dimethylbenzimidazole phosphoribosyltransferase [Streptomyces sp. NPDC093707]|uniref:nicotinate-nucleotide--dimethylbenzimidazole phosphoribosyltransferase n=1 Tax=Streptomyces sp. NPDC093707 TaxID=3154984 RepID=UPI00344E91DD